MAFENKMLRCVECGVDFEFTANEQAFFVERGLQAPPKRCKPCRKAAKARFQTKSPGAGIYRSPAFEASAPVAQQMRGQRGRGPGGRSGPQQRGRADYRSPAFRDLDGRDFEQDYRSPAFRDIDRVKPEEEYRAPGFKEAAALDVNAEYRSPGFQDLRGRQRDERPMFEITCAECNQVAMVPFLPEEKEGPHFCQECYAAQRKRQAEERAAAAAQAAAVEKVAAAQAAAAQKVAAEAQAAAGAEAEPESPTPEPAPPPQTDD